MDGERRKTGEQLSFPGKSRGEAPRVSGVGEVCEVPAFISSEIFIRSHLGKTPGT